MKKTAIVSIISGISNANYVLGISLQFYSMHNPMKPVTDIEIVYLSNHLNCRYIQYRGVLTGT